MKAKLAHFAAGMLLTMPVLAADEDDAKAAFAQFVSAQNAHDVAAVGDTLLDSPDFLWITRGTPVWGRGAALKRFESLYQGAWHLSPDAAALKVTMLNGETAQVFVPIVFTIGSPGQPAIDTTFLMNQTLVKTSGGWRVATILPISAAAAPLAPAK